MQEKFMKMAIKEAIKAQNIDEVPIGAIIVKDGVVIAKAHNLMEKTQLATAHAEILAINKACKKLKSWRLDGAEIYITMDVVPEAMIVQELPGRADHQCRIDLVITEPQEIASGIR